ncbi:hypothetical protein J6590_107534 [Homalodisca vitripennis]|nr:hypothetical protein J6590_107534 [Homalodisca vitripennis]
MDRTTTPTNSNSSTSPDILYTSLNELESSLNENNTLNNLENNDEKLQMAAKIGAALLEENNILKEKNIRLDAKLEMLEEKIEKLENEENKYLKKIEDLLQNVSEVQVQLEKEKKLRLDTQNIFEEHDSKQGQLIDDYAKMINCLQITIKNLEKEMRPQETQKSELPTYMSNETQTEALSHCTPRTTTCSSNLLVEIGQLKSKQDSLENAVKDLTSQFQSIRTEIPTNSENQGTVITQSHNSITNNMQVKSNRTSSGRGTKNCFSVALQVAKHHCRTIQGLGPMTSNKPIKTNVTEEEAEAGNENCPLTAQTTTLRDTGGTMKPPVSAKLLAPNETYLDFFNKNAEHYRATSRAAAEAKENAREISKSQPADNGLVTDTLLAAPTSGQSPPFLDRSFKTKSRYKSRLILNSMLKEHIKH